MAAEVTPKEIFRGHIPELDGLRAAGMLAVMLDHFWPDSLSTAVCNLTPKAWIAMDSFFVLSGFLIAGILLDTPLGHPGSYRGYYIRRSLRIFPLYYCVITYQTCVALFWHGGGQYRNLVAHWGSPAWFFIYLGNFRTAIAGAFPIPAGFIPLWSLQIEEQFYLLFPFMIGQLRRKTLTRTLWVMVFLSPVLRVGLFFWNPHNPYLQFVLPVCRMEGLALGALIAIRFRKGPWGIRKGRLTALTIALLAATWVCSSLSNTLRSLDEWTTPFNRTVGYWLSSVACACLLLWLIQFRGSGLTGWLRWRPMQYLGKISYGTYLLHLPVAAAVSFVWRILGWRSPGDSFLWLATAMALSIACASASWHLLERPVLRLRDRLAPVVRTQPGLEKERSPEDVSLPADDYFSANAKPALSFERTQDG